MPETLNGGALGLCPSEAATSALASERPVSAQSGAMTRLLFPEPLLWLPSSSRFLPVSTRAPLPCRLYVARSLQEHRPCAGEASARQALQGVAWSGSVHISCMAPAPCRRSDLA